MTMIDQIYTLLIQTTRFYIAAVSIDLQGQCLLVYFDVSHFFHVFVFDCLTIDYIFTVYAQYMYVGTRYTDLEKIFLL